MGLKKGQWVIDRIPVAEAITRGFLDKNGDKNDITDSVGFKEIREGKPEKFVIVGGGY